VIALVIWRHHVRKVGLALMAALFLAPGAAAAKTGKVYGIIYTLGSDGGADSLAERAYHPEKPFQPECSFHRDQ